MTDDAEEEIMAGSTSTMTDDAEEDIMAGSTSNMTDEAEEDIMAGSIEDQAPPFWDDKIDWTIDATPYTRRRFQKILRSADYTTREKWMSQRFHRELDRVKQIRAKKQEAYAKKEIKRRPMSVQNDRNLNKCVMATVTVPKTTPDELLKHVRKIMALHGIAEKKIVAETDANHHWQTTMKIMSDALRKNTQHVEGLRIRTCSFDILGVTPTRDGPIATPFRGDGTGSKSNPVDIDQETGIIHPGVILIRTGGPTSAGCSYQNSIDGRCHLCRQVPIAFSSPNKVRRPRLWSARDKRGDRNISRIIRAQEIVDANLDVPCSRGAASSPLLAPITKRTRTIHWSGVFVKNKEAHEKQKRRKKKERKQQQQHQQKKRKKKKKQIISTKSISTTLQRKLPTKRSKSDHVLSILGDLDTLTVFHRDAPLFTKISGTNAKLSMSASAKVLRQRIQLTNGAILLQKRTWRRAGGIRTTDLF